MAELHATASLLIGASIAPASQRTYQSGVERYARWCSATALRPVPAVEEQLVLFVAHLYRENLVAVTVRVYLSGIRFHHVKLGASVVAFQGVRLAAAVQGFHRLQPRGKSKRSPLSMDQLLVLQQALASATCLSSQDAAMLWAALTLAFYGWFRVSEYVSPSSTSFNRDRTLLRAHVAVEAGSVTVDLRASKTDQLGEGATIVMGATGDGTCPVLAMRRYLACTRRPPGEPLFAFGSGRYLTADDVNFWLRRFVGPTTSSHSLRSGGTTAAAKAGAPTWLIKLGGRWRSDAYLKYVEPEPTARAVLAALVGANSRR